MKHEESIIIHGQSVRVIVGKKGGGYIQLMDLCKAMELKYHYTLLKFRNDPGILKDMSKQLGIRSDGQPAPMWCISLRRVLVDFYGTDPLTRSLSGFITRKELLKLYGFL